jgi:hypothetical protein
LVLAEFEVRDRLAGFRQHGLLTCDGTEVALNVRDLVLIGLGIDTGVKAYFKNLWHLVLILIAAALHELSENVLGVDFFESGNVAHGRSHRITDPVA